MDKYVVGFAFNEDKTSILLVRKIRPRWMIGLLNGIGGKIEKGEKPLDAMNRECREETGLTRLIWMYKGIMSGTNDDSRSFECHIFYAYNQDIFRYRQIEDELLKIYKVSNITQEQTVRNVQFLVPYGTCNDGSRFMNLIYQ